MARSAVRNSARDSRRQAYPHQGSSTLPRLNRALYIKNAYPFVDRDGKHDGPSQLLQYASVASGTVTLYHPSLTGAETITSRGDAPVSVIAGGIVIGAGKAWSIRDNAGHHWTYCAALSATSVVMWDVGGLGDHLIAEGLSEVVVTALCSTSRDLTAGTDWLDRGFTLADGNQYLHPVSGGLIPVGVVIPKIESGAGCCAYEVAA